MALRPVTRRSVPDEVFDQILDDVVSGELPAGERLPSERRLAEVLGVSRPAVREALQRMAAARLVEVRHGGATLVRSFERFAGLDLLPRLLLRGDELDLRVARSILEARLAVGPQVARLAAERADDVLCDGLDRTIDDLAASDDPVEQQLLALAFWDRVVDGADSVAFRLMFNSLRAAYEPALEALASVMQTELRRIDGYRAVATAVRDGDADRALAAADALLRPMTTDFIALIDRLEDEE
jgi:GntR family transcriptional repressor for pyruvate dehydrogenase complex